MLVVVAAWFRPMDNAAEAQLDRGLTSAFAAFATARALNAAISLVQSGEVSAQLGVGMSVHPGELLDPLNDLVERFADLMLSATVAFGVQKVMLAIGAHWVVPALLTVTVLAWAGLALGGRARPRWLGRALAILLLARFMVPVATLGTELLSDTFLASKQAASERALEELKGRAESASRAEPADNGLVGMLKGWVNRGADLGGQVDKLAQAASRVAEHVTDLIVVFLLQTLLFPLALAWLMYQALLAFLRAAGAD